MILFAPTSRLTYILVNEAVDDLSLDLVDARRIVRVVCQDAIHSEGEREFAWVVDSWYEAVAAACVAYRHSVLQDHLNKTLFTSFL